MTLSLREWQCWSPGSKLELLNGQLIVGDSLTHSRLLLSQILRGWGLSAVLPLAPLPLWWEAIAAVFDLPPAIASDPMRHLDEVRAWANRVSFEPEHPQHEGHKGSWRWTYSRSRQDLRMAMYGLERDRGRLGQSIGGGFVNRLGEDGLMPDVCFYRGKPRNRLYEYFVEGPPEVVVEFLQPGCVGGASPKENRYGSEVKRDRYEAATVPELWLVDVVQKEITLLRWSPEGYQSQQPDTAGQYHVSSVPGLTFFPDRLWEDEAQRGYSSNSSLFSVGPEAKFLETRIPYVGKGMDETRGLIKLQAQLEPDAIAFEDYIYWCPEAKFEFIEGRPWLGGREGTQGLLGMLLKTFGLIEAVKLAHPQDWIEALLQLQSEDNRQTKRQNWWNVAQQNAQFLRDQFGVTKVAVAGELSQDQSLDYWSKLILVVWGAPEPQKPYTSLQQVIDQINKDPEIQLIFADRELSNTEARLIESGWIELS